MSLPDFWSDPIGRFKQDLSDFFYNAATGKLSDSQKQDIYNQVEADVTRAAGGNTEAAHAGVISAQASLSDVFTQADNAADASWQTKLIGWIELALIVFITFYVISIVGQAKENFFWIKHA